MSQKVLSICIPTYNRVKSLEKLLTEIYHQIEPLNSKEVEVLVSDNFSSDETFDVSKKFLNEEGFIYHRQPENYGAVRNVIDVVDMATGKYCWLIGDDDYLHTNAITDVLEMLSKTNCNYKAYFVNTYFVSDSKRDKIYNNIGEPVGNRQIPLFNDEVFNSGEYLFEYYDSPGLFTTLINFIFTKEAWDKSLKLLGKDKFMGSMFHNCHTTFPHSVIWSNFIISEPVFFHSNPVLYFFVGQQNWFDKWNAMCITSVLELSLIFERNGGDKKMIKRYQTIVMNRFIGEFYAFIERDDEFLKQVFDLEYFLNNYYSTQSFWKVISTKVSTSYLIANKRIFFNFLLRKGIFSYYFYQYFVPELFRILLRKLRYTFK